MIYSNMVHRFANVFYSNLFEIYLLIADRYIPAWQWICKIWAKYWASVENLMEFSQILPKKVLK